MSTTEPHELAQTMSRVVRDLEGEPDEHQTLAGIVQAAVATVPGVAYGGITQVHRRRVTAQVPTDELVRRCDELQEELAEGPCLHAIWQHHTVVVNDLATDTRWPRFGPGASELGPGSLISFRLYVRDDTLGALNLYGTSDTHFDTDAQQVGEVFATHAALALSEARQYRQLHEALASRDDIGQAKGLLMCQHNITGQRAFDLLVRASQDANLKLTDIAAWFVGEHDSPGHTPRPAHPDT